MAGAKGESGADAGVSGTSAADTTLGPCRPMRGDGGGGRIAESLQLTGGSGQQLDGNARALGSNRLTPSSIVPGERPVAKRTLQTMTNEASAITKAKSALQAQHTTARGGACTESRLKETSATARAFSRALPPVVPSIPDSVAIGDNFRSAAMAGRAPRDRARGPGRAYFTARQRKLQRQGEPCHRERAKERGVLGHRHTEACTVNLHTVALGTCCSRMRNRGVGSEKLKRLFAAEARSAIEARCARTPTDRGCDQIPIRTPSHLC